MIANCVINLAMCKREVSKFNLYYFFIYLNVVLFFYFHLQPKLTTPNAKGVAYSLLFLSGIKQYYRMSSVLKQCEQYEQCACFDSECQRKARYDGRRTSASLVSDESLNSVNSMNSRNGVLVLTVNVSAKHAATVD